MPTKPSKTRRPHKNRNNPKPQPLRQKKQPEKKTNPICQTLETLYKKYNRKSLIPPDPLQFVYRFTTKHDMEIAAILSAALAYGRVTQIQNSLEKLFTIMNHQPAEFTLNLTQADKTLLAPFKHRFNTGTDIYNLLNILKHIYENASDLETFFTRSANQIQIDPITSLKITNQQNIPPDTENTDILPALTAFCDRIYQLHRKLNNPQPSSASANTRSAAPIEYLITSPAKGSACKRMNLFLRWMIRSDRVDPGLWTSIPKSKLIVPTDVHIARLTRFLGLHSRNDANLKTALQITQSFKKFAPHDPAKYDFALSRVGITENCTGKPSNACPTCQLQPFCLTNNKNFTQK